VDRTYEQVDRWIGELLELLPEGTVIVVVSDHGMATVGDVGDHHPYGIFVAAGQGIRQGAELGGASALDVAPTLLHLYDAPIPLDMDGKLLVQLYDPQWLEQHPPRYSGRQQAVATQEAPLEGATDEMMEKLRGIGYFE
jgi:predicted AlkP superfamily phosphohydrolase/phosphomutase